MHFPTTTLSLLLSTVSAIDIRLYSPENGPCNGAAIGCANINPGVRNSFPSLTLPFYVAYSIPISQVCCFSGDFRSYAGWVPVPRDWRITVQYGASDSCADSRRELYIHACWGTAGRAACE